MIILKILLYILLAVMALILVVLITPAGGEFSYIDGKFRYKVKLWVINLMDSEGGGLYGWWKKRKANKKDKPEKPKKAKKSKPVKEKKSKKKKKQREKYEWEKELDDIPVNDPEADMLPAVTDDKDSEADTAAESFSADTAQADGHDEAPDKKDNKKKDDTDEDPFESDDDDNKDDEEKKSLSDKVEFLVGVWESAQRPMLKIFKGFKLKDFYIDFLIADEDACDCALKYGKYSTLIFSGIAFFSQIFTVRLKTIDVRPAFGLSKGRWDTSGKLSFRLGTAVIAGAWFLLTYFFRTFLPEKLRKRKMKKSAARQK